MEDNNIFIFNFQKRKDRVDINIIRIIWINILIIKRGCIKSAISAISLFFIFIQTLQASLE